jgi:hypothetical protein
MNLREGKNYQHPPKTKHSVENSWKMLKKNDWEERDIENILIFILKRMTARQQEIHLCTVLLAKKETKYQCLRQSRTFWDGNGSSDPKCRATAPNIAIFKKEKAEKVVTFDIMKLIFNITYPEGWYTALLVMLFYSRLTF